jgi:hypothetical protein
MAGVAQLPEPLLAALAESSIPARPRPCLASVGCPASTRWPPTTGRRRPGQRRGRAIPHVGGGGRKFGVVTAFEPRVSDVGAGARRVRRTTSGQTAQGRRAGRRDDGRRLDGLMTMVIARKAPATTWRPSHLHRVLVVMIGTWSADPSPNRRPRRVLCAGTGGRWSIFPRSAQHPGHGRWGSR